MGDWLTIVLAALGLSGICYLLHVLEKRADRYRADLKDRNDQRAHERRIAYQKLVGEIQRSVQKASHEMQTKLLERAHELNDESFGEDWKS